MGAVATKPGGRRAVAVAVAAGVAVAVTAASVLLAAGRARAKHLEARRVFGVEEEEEEARRKEEEEARRRAAGRKSANDAARQAKEAATATARFLSNLEPAATGGSRAAAGGGNFWTDNNPYPLRTLLLLLYWWIRLPLIVVAGVAAAAQTDRQASGLLSLFMMGALLGPAAALLVLDVSTTELALDSLDGAVRVLALCFVGTYISCTSFHLWQTWDAVIDGIDKGIQFLEVVLLVITLSSIWLAGGSGIVSTCVSLYWGLPAPLNLVLVFVVLVMIVGIVSVYRDICRFIITICACAWCILPAWFCVKAASMPAGTLGLLIEVLKGLGGSFVEFGGWYIHMAI
jgi:hypothetical protein